jgi:hypothetical protein
MCFFLAILRQNNCSTQSHKATQDEGIRKTSVQITSEATSPQPEPEVEFCAHGSETGNSRMKHISLVQINLIRLTQNFQLNPFVLYVEKGNAKCTHPYFLKIHVQVNAGQRH